MHPTSKILIPKQIKNDVLKMDIYYNNAIFNYLFANELIISEG